MSKGYFEKYLKDKRIIFQDIESTNLLQIIWEYFPYSKVISISIIDPEDIWLGELKTWMG